MNTQLAENLNSYVFDESDLYLSDIQTAIEYLSIDELEFLISLYRGMIEFFHTDLYIKNRLKIVLGILTTTNVYS